MTLCHIDVKLITKSSVKTLNIYFS